jgi:molybdopterin-guanine dinucleotide biosynthesis protein A
MTNSANTSVAVFAGGKSTRFGSPKIKAKIADIEFGLLIIETLKRAGFMNICLIGGDSEDARRWGIDFHEDIYPESGPLGALLTALQTCHTEFLMTLPCDVPFIDEDTCRRLGNLAPGVDVLVARTDTPQWLSSTWRRSIYDVIKNDFESGERAIHRIIEKLKFEFVDVSGEILLNVNEPNQLEHQPKTN